MLIQLILLTRLVHQYNLPNTSIHWSNPTITYFCSTETTIRGFRGGCHGRAIKYERARKKLLVASCFLSSRSLPLSLSLFLSLYLSFFFLSLSPFLSLSVSLFLSVSPVFSPPQWEKEENSGTEWLHAKKYHVCETWCFQFRRKEGGRGEGRKGRNKQEWRGRKRRRKRSKRSSFVRFLLTDQNFSNASNTHTHTHTYTHTYV